jgi:outer membrane protein
LVTASKAILYMPMRELKSYNCLIFLLALTIPLFAQRKSTISAFSLQDCISRALANNIALKQNKLQTSLSKNTLTSSQLAQYPSINGSFSQYFTAGRSIDPFTNQFIEDRINYQNVGLNANWLVYGGGQQRNTIRMNELGVLASETDGKVIEKQLVLNVIETFFRVLNDEERLVLAKQQLASTKFQLSRFEAQVREGIVSRSMTADLTAQLAGDELAIATAENAIELSKTALLQLMNFPLFGAENLRLENEMKVLPSIEAYKEPNIVNMVVKKQSAVMAAQLRSQMAQKGIETAFSSKYPTLWLYFGLGTNYSSAAPTEQFISDGKAPKLVESKLRDYVLVNGQRQNIMRVSEAQSGSYRNFGYFDQLDFNLNNSLGLSLKIPMFNGLSAKYKIENAKIYKQIADLQLKTTEQYVKNMIDVAYKNTLSAYKRLLLAQKQRTAVENAFAFTKTRFEEGIINSVEYTLAKNNLDRIRVNHLQAQYDYLFRTKVLDFYLGEL